jgi:hypothetical protein
MRTLYFKRPGLHALFLVHVFKHKINYRSIMDTAGLRVPTKQIRDSSILNAEMTRDLTLHQGNSQLQTASLINTHYFPCRALLLLQSYYNGIFSVFVLTILF